MQKIEEKLKSISEVFSPSSPITNKSSFYGRYNETKKILDAIYEKGKHVVIYGERGIGKTSISNIINLTDSYSIRITCNRKNSFDTIWREILKKLTLLLKFEPIKEEHKSVTKLIATLLEVESIEVESISYIINKLNERVVIILDEFDILEDPGVFYSFADTIKSFSDNCPLITIVFVGIADSVTDLLGEHPSLERCIAQINIPRMSKQELSDIIDSALIKLKFRIDPLVKEDMIKFSQGFPHYIHLLGKYCCQSATEMHYDYIIRTNFDSAINDAIDNIYENIQMIYQKATISNKKNSLYTDVIFASILIEEEENGMFKATDLIAPLIPMLKRPHLKVNAFSYHLAKLSTPAKGPIYQAIKLDRVTRYKFKNPLVRAYVHLLAYKKGLLEKEKKR